ncbi:MAG: FAD-binding and (Fe-S)-binding domain-containing protein [Hyphomicrobiaceae bacterium]
MRIHDQGSRRLAERLAREIEGEVLFDVASRGRYATDASFYQIMPAGVVVPRRQEDLDAIVALAREEGVALLPRGGGTSQSGQTVGDALVVDCSKYLDGLLAFDAEARTCTVEPGIVLDELNRRIAKSGLWFPVDVSTKSRATIGGMAGNNSCGTRSIRYGVMRDNVLAIDAILADGSQARFAGVGPGDLGTNIPDSAREIFRDLLMLGEQERDVLESAYPKTARRVGGYNLDALVPGGGAANLATLLVGSEGTLALSRRLDLKLARQPRNKALGICHFPTFRRAMEATAAIVGLGPVAVEVVDRTLLELGRDIPMFRPVMERYVQGSPDALLLTEFAEEDQVENERRLARLDELMGDLGLPNAVVKVTDGAGQRAVWEVREAGLNIMMSMKSEGKPVSFIEDCAVPLAHLADYTERLTEVFTRHGTKGTWYAHASVGCLHVRPVLNLKLEKDVKTMRAIAEEAFAMVREYKGAHSGEHGDGLVRSEFHEAMYGRDVVRLFERVKDRIDPAGLFNPGKVVRPPRMDDRSLFRFKPDYRVEGLETVLDWSAWPGAGGGFQGAVEMCNNNGACRKLEAGVMCPSYRATRNERDVTRGRANTLRLAISGQLGEAGLASAEVHDALALCVSCKGCRHECPTGVDMAKMKIEALAARNHARHGVISLRDRLVAHLPRYAPYARYLAPLLNLRNASPLLARLAEPVIGMSRHRKLPRWRFRPFSRTAARVPEAWRPETFTTENLQRNGRQGPFACDPPKVAVLFADTFNRTFEPENLDDTLYVLEALGYSVSVAGAGERRPLCCGRTYLAAGLVEEAKAEARRMLAALAEPLRLGLPIVGIEPSCLLTLRDEFLAMGLGEPAGKLAASSFLLEEFLVREAKAGRIGDVLGRLDGTAHLHTHCHQKAFGAAGAVEQTLRMVEGLTVKPIESGCCGMAGSFGYQAETYDVSMAMGEASLLPAVRQAAAGEFVLADGFSCRHQIKDGTAREAMHVAGLLRRALAGGAAPAAGEVAGGAP